MRLTPHYTIDEATGTVMDNNGDEIFVTNLRGEAAAHLANFYDMAYCRGMNRAVVQFHNVSVDIQTKNRDVVDWQNTKVW